MTQRYYDNRSRGIRDRLVKGHGDAPHNDAMAKAAEDFFADRYGLPPDNSRRPKNAEFVIKGKRGRPATSIDVKWTPYSSGHLIHRLDSRTKATAYVLVIGEDPASFRIAGWAWGKDLFASVKDLGHGPTHALSQDQLRRNTDILMASLGCELRR